ncbi:hypothetical protein ACWGCI_36350 [Streptomyces sp. NPDC054949]
MTKTTYDSFDGISPTGTNLTTPRDLAKLTRYAMKGKVFPHAVHLEPGQMLPGGL